MMEFEQILFQAKRGEIQAIDQILGMFRPMLIRNAMVNGTFDEDLYQELVMEVLRCIRCFKEL